MERYNFVFDDTPCIVEKIRIDAKEHLYIFKTEDSKAQIWIPDDLDHPFFDIFLKSVGYTILKFFLRSREKNVGSFLVFEHGRLRQYDIERTYYDLIRITFANEHTLDVHVGDDVIIGKYELTVFCSIASNYGRDWLRQTTTVTSEIYKKNYVCFSPLNGAKLRNLNYRQVNCCGGTDYVSRDIDEALFTNALEYYDSLWLQELVWTDDPQFQKVIQKIKEDNRRYGITVERPHILREFEENIKNHYFLKSLGVVLS